MPTHQGHPLFVPLSACRTFYSERSISLPVNHTIIENAFWYSYRGERERDMPERFNCAISWAILYFVLWKESKLKEKTEKQNAVKYRLFLLKKFKIDGTENSIVIGIKATLLLQIVMKILL